MTTTPSSDVAGITGGHKVLHSPQPKETWEERFKNTFWWQADGSHAKFSAEECQQIIKFIRTIRDEAIQDFAQTLIKDYAEGNFVGLGSIAKLSGLSPTKKKG